MTQDPNYTEYDDIPEPVEPESLEHEPIPDPVHPEEGEPESFPEPQPEEMPEVPPEDYVAPLEGTPRDDYPHPYVEREGNRNKTLITVLIVFAVLILCCCCLVIGLSILGMESGTWEEISSALFLLTG